MDHGTKKKQTTTIKINNKEKIMLYLSKTIEP
jgi:hypothetical protein